jgi:hypothetical protein
MAALAVVVEPFQTVELELLEKVTTVETVFLLVPSILPVVVAQAKLVQMLDQLAVMGVMAQPSIA